MSSPLSDPPPDPVAVVDHIEAVFQRWGAEAYLGEAVTQAQHMLQAAHHAERAGASDAEVAAALLHDLGHFLVADNGLEDLEDHRHEEAGAAWLARYFPPAVVEPVRQHVAAKRYLCAVEPEYFATLSAASVHSLALQGGTMDAAEVAAFEALPWHSSCVKVRRWDDLAKEADRPTPPFGHYRPLLVGLLESRENDSGKPS